MLFTPKQNVTIDQIEDLSKVLSPTRSIKRISEIEHATVIPVAQFNSFFGASCVDNGQMLHNGDSAYGRCSDCSTAVKLDRCFRQTSALLSVHSSDNAHPIKLLAVHVHDQLSKIAGLSLEQVMDIALMPENTEFQIKYNNVTKQMVHIDKY